MPAYSRRAACSGIEDYQFQFKGPDLVYAIVVTKPAGQCSPVKFDVKSNDEATTFGKTKKLFGGQHAWVPVEKLARGLQILKIGRSGFVEGCNGGFVESWGTKVDVQIMPQ